MKKVSFLFPRKEKEMSSTPNYNIDYEDERFKEVETERDNALTEVDQQYGEMIGNTDKYYQDLINQSKENADKMAEVQNQNKNFAIEKIEQQREQYKKDYQKEQSGAYVDWQKQSNQYGAKAEQMAMQGMVGTGYQESSQTAMYVAYQNRVATAREVMAQANMNCDNGIKDAILQNNSKLAEIYANANKEQLEIALQGFQYKNDLLENQMNREMQLKQFYSNEWQNVLNQMNVENALAEEVRQANIQQAQWEKEYQQKIAEFEEQKRQFDVEIARLKAKDEEEARYKAQQLELQKQQLAEEQRQFNLQYQASKRSSGGSSGGGSYNLGNSYALQTEYYQGSYNKDCQYGTFSNGYQPNNINNTKLKNSGATFTFNTQTLSGKKQTVTQTVWTANGKYYYWEGRENRYIELKYNSKTGKFSVK